MRTGLPAEGGGARGGEGSGREVEARNDHGCSLWPTAKRFCSPLRKTHRVNSCVYLNDGKTPAITGENGLTRAGAFVQTRTEDAFAALSNIKDAQFRRFPSPMQSPVRVRRRRVSCFHAQRIDGSRKGATDTTFPSDCRRIHL